MIETAAWAAAALGRIESPADYDPFAVPSEVLITGAAGTIGAAIADRLDGSYRTDVFGVEDRWTLDVRDPRAVEDAVNGYQPDLIIHMAAAKHAPAGEENPIDPFEVHVTGTVNVLRAAAQIGARVVVASTCKACDPETAYGASKLIAERLALNAGQTVVRFYNVVETSGNVFEIWGAMPVVDRLSVTPCLRRFMTLQEAVCLTLWASMRGREPGRYVQWPTVARPMTDVIEDVWPRRPYDLIPPRRGDRIAEPELARCEVARVVDASVAQVFNPHDDGEVRWR